MKNIITIDWEDWFHVCEVDSLLPRDRWDTFPSILDEATDRILELLGRHNVRATFFVVGYAAGRHPDLIRRIAAQGHEIAYHSFDHGLLHEATPSAFAADLRRGKVLLEEICGQAVVGFRAPQWSLNDRCAWAVDALIREGFRYDSSRAPLPIIGRMGLPQCPHVLRGEGGGGRILELPPLVLCLPGLNVPAGGGWGLRTWPLGAVLRKVRKLNNMGCPATFFFHPVEFVTHRHGPRLPPVKRFVLSFGLRTAERIWEFLFDNIVLTTAAESISTHRLIPGAPEGVGGPQA
jgi:polysaccharide deacetylase family protein (PEP-CTERM system associated)